MLLGALYFGGLVLFLMAGIHVASAIFMTAVVSDWMSMQVLPSMIGNTMWSTMNEFLLVAIPLFILLGEILTRSGVADRMYKALAAWLQWLPGGLLHTNIATCALFAATSGSSVATSATVGTVALPTLQRLGYRERLVLGSIAAGGTLGILISAQHQHGGVRRPGRSVGGQAVRRRHRSRHHRAAPDDGGDRDHGPAGQGRPDNEKLIIPWRCGSSC